MYFQEYKQSLPVKELQSRINEILELIEHNQLDVHEVTKLCDQIIEHKTVIPCIKSLPPTTNGYNPWHKVASP